jgi:hypothetical protein
MLCRLFTIDNENMELIRLVSPKRKWACGFIEGNWGFPNLKRAKLKLMQMISQKLNRTLSTLSWRKKLERSALPLCWERSLKMRGL